MAMSVFKIMYNKYGAMQDLKNLVNYAIKPEHCMEGIYGAQGVLKGNSDEMYRQMYLIRKTDDKPCISFCHLVKRRKSLSD